MNLKYITFFLVGICASAALNNSYAMQGADKDQEKKPARERTENMRNVNLAQTGRQFVPQGNIHYNSFSNPLSFVNQQRNTLPMFPVHQPQYEYEEWVPYGMVFRNRNTQNLSLKFSQFQGESVVERVQMSGQPNINQMMYAQQLNDTRQVLSHGLPINGANQGQLGRQLRLNVRISNPVPQSGGIRSLCTHHNPVQTQTSEQRETVNLTGDSQKHNEAPSSSPNKDDPKTKEEKDQK